MSIPFKKVFDTVDHGIMVSAAWNIIGFGRI